MQFDHNRDTKILTDDAEISPIMGFDTYSRSIVNIINGSTPRFSIGIYGEWGTGKTTLMRLIESEIKNNENTLTVWFNAWRYEREEQFAITALMKTVAYAMETHPIYAEIKPILLRSVKIFTKGFLSEVASKFIGEKGVDEFKERLLPKMDLLAEVDKDTIYFDGIYQIEKEMSRIMNNYHSSKVVIFIDDLDRCSPKKALEVFESIKVFLDIEGFVFVIGLSHETVSKLISTEYKESGVKGEHYIRKIIQIPINVPQWNNLDVKDIILNLLNRDKIDPKYSAILRENLELISFVVEPSPREVKRFINNFIISYEVLYSHNPSMEQKELLVTHALKFRWNSFYKAFSSDKEFRDLIGRSLNTHSYAAFKTLLNEGELQKNIETEREKLGGKGSMKRLLMPIMRESPHDIKYRMRIYDGLFWALVHHREALMEIDVDLWTLLKREFRHLELIKNWEVFRTVADFAKEIPTSNVMEKENNSIEDQG